MVAQTSTDEVTYLQQFAKTEWQREVLSAMIDHGSVRATAGALGKSKTAVMTVLTRCRRYAAMHDAAPGKAQTRAKAETHVVKGDSTLYDKDGKVVLSWVKTDLAKSARLQMLRDAVSDITEAVEGLKAPAAVPATNDADHLSAYVIGDQHLGMYAWKAEAGEDYDLDIAQGQLLAATDELVRSAPESETAIIVNLGDFFHADTPDNRTGHSGHALDVDTRHAKVFRAGYRTFERLIDRVLQKHKNVIVFITKGNHDPESSFALAEVLAAIYRRESRVDIRGGVRWREYYRFGKVLLGITHGDKARPASLPGIMAAECHEDWGNTKCRRWLVGHYHHQERKEHPGVIVEIFPTLAAKDAWHASMGYLSERAMNCIIYHKEHGEVGRRMVGVPELESKK